MNACELYQKAYDEQYSRKDYVAACKKYIMIMDQFPGSAEADLARIQLDGIEKKFRMEQTNPSTEGTECLELIAKAKEAGLRKEKQEEEATAYAMTLFENGINVEDLLFVDQAQKKWAVSEKTQTGKVTIRKVYAFDELINYDVFQDNTSISGDNASVSLSDLMFFGVADAVIGSAVLQAETISDLYINLTVNDFQSPTVRITILDSETSKESDEYKKAVLVCEKIVSLLRLIIDDNKTKDSVSQAKAVYTISVADEIMKFKKMADDGIITREEFEAQKQKLLKLEY